jgi:hypothetical protein
MNTRLPRMGTSAIDTFSSRIVTSLEGRNAA